MISYVVIDTEGTGLFNYKLPADDPSQPRLASIAMLFLNEELQLQKQLSFFVRPDGWTMPKEATAIHGLTDDFLVEHGIPIGDILDAYIAAVEAGRVVVGFNVVHDLKYIRGELRRAGRPDLFERTPNICLMRAATGVCKIPKANGKGYKFPKLMEACRHFKIEQPEEHTALGDATVAAEILRRLAALGCLPEPQVHYATTRPA